MFERLEWWLIDADCWLVLAFMALGCAIKDSLWLNCGLILVRGSMLVAVTSLSFVWLISVISAVWIGLSSILVLEFCRRISHSKVQRQSWVIKGRSSRGTNSCGVNWVERLSHLVDLYLIRQAST